MSLIACLPKLWGSGDINHSQSAISGGTLNVFQYTKHLIVGKNMKAPKACRPCREGKRRCLRRTHLIGEPCDPCLKRRIQCTGTPSRLPPTEPLSLLPRPATVSEWGSPGEDGTHSSIESLSGDQRQVDMDVEVALQLVDYYLGKVHNRSHSLFHPRLLREKVRGRLLNRALLLALCSIGSRFSTDAKVRELEVKLMEESKRRLLDDLENICIENVQTCILVANLCAAHLNPSSEALFFRRLTSFPSDLRSASQNETLIASFRNWNRHGSGHGPTHRVKARQRHIPD